MPKEIVINKAGDRVRIAILEKKELTELYVENAENSRTIGDIYLGRVRNLMPSIQAAFVDIGQKQDAFLHFSDVEDNIPEVLKLVGEKPTLGKFPVQMPTRYRSVRDREDASELSELDKSNGHDPSKSKDFVHPARYLKNGQKILVQITKEPIASKGSRITSAISLAGRFLVLVPCADYVAVSRKIWSVRERKRLKALAKSLLPAGYGLIVRTVAEGRDAKTIDTDLNLLLDKWKRILEKLQQTERAPQLLYQDVSMVSSVVRDMFTDEYGQILIDDPRLQRSIKNYVRAVAPSLEQAVKQYEGDKPIFESVGIADSVAEAFDSRVDLRSGGYIFIEHTEAMHVIDVNSGSAGKGKSQDENSLRVNLEAARVIAQQLRIRDLGGIICVDFIDMRESSNRKKVYEEMRRAFRQDRAVTKVLPISDFGLMQITRQRLRPSITRDESLIEDVTKARGERDLRALAEAKEAMAEVERLRVEMKKLRDKVGKRDPEKFLAALGRWLQRWREDSNEPTLHLQVHPFAAAFLRRRLSAELRKIQRTHKVKLVVVEEGKLAPTTFNILDPKTGEVVRLMRKKSASGGKGKRGGRNDRRSARGPRGSRGPRDRPKK